MVNYNICLTFTVMQHRDIFFPGLLQVLEYVMNISSLPKCFCFLIFGYIFQIILPLSDLLGLTLIKTICIISLLMSTFSFKASFNSREDNWRIIELFRSIKPLGQNAEPFTSLIFFFFLSLVTIDPVSVFQDLGYSAHQIPSLNNCTFLSFRFLFPFCFFFFSNTEIMNIRS